MEETLWSVIARTIQQSGSIEKAVFFLLVALSLVSWTIIFWKISALLEMRRNSQRFMAVFDSADSFGAAAGGAQAAGPSAFAAVFRAAVDALENRKRAG